MSVDIHVVTRVSFSIDEDVAKSLLYILDMVQKSTIEDAYKDSLSELTDKLGLLIGKPEKKRKKNDIKQPEDDD